MMRPLIPNSDYHRWKALLREAGVRDARLHDTRHTAATVLLVLGVPERTVMSVMGWSSTSMAARYQHVTDPIRRDVARRVGGLLWADEGAPAIPTETTGRLAGSTVRALGAFAPVVSAKDAGFEPARACTQPAFQNPRTSGTAASSALKPVMSAGSGACTHGGGRRRSRPQLRPYGRWSGRRRPSGHQLRRRRRALLHPDDQTRHP